MAVGPLNIDPRFNTMTAKHYAGQNIPCRSSAHSGNFRFKDEALEGVSIDP